MKLIKKIAVLLFVGMFSSQGYSQLSAGGQISYLKISGVSTLGFGAKGDYALSDKNMVSFGFTYYAPKSFEPSSASASAIDDLNPIPNTSVEVTEKVGFINVFVEGKRYFVGETDDDFNVYGLAGVGFLRAAVSVDIEEYNEALYSLDYSYESYSLSQLTINFGIGAEKDLGFGYIFSDIKLNMPANRQNGQAVEINLPASLLLNLGVRIPFG